MGFAKRIDRNQPEIVAALRKAGCTVQHLHEVGSGCPDLLVAIGEEMCLMEVKDGAKPASAQKLTPDQAVWHAAWQADVHIVNSIPAALAVVEIYRARAASKTGEKA